MGNSRILTRIQTFTKHISPMSQEPWARPRHWIKQVNEAYGGKCRQLAKMGMMMSWKLMSQVININPSLILFWMIHSWMNDVDEGKRERERQRSMAKLRQTKQENVNIPFHHSMSWVLDYKISIIAMNKFVSSFLLDAKCIQHIGPPTPQKTRNICQLFYYFYFSCTWCMELLV